MRRFSRHIMVGSLLFGAASASFAAVPAIAASAAPAHSTVIAAPATSPGDGTPAGAVSWMRGHLGYTGLESYCEKAVEEAYGTSGIWPSAIAHWRGAPEHTSGTAPAGSFVYWNISAYGHVGIADGSGGFYSTSVNGAIGHESRVSYFSNYLGWTPGARPYR
jgi:hypothetical protein